MNDQLDQETIHCKEDLQALRQAGFTEEEIMRLSRLRRDHHLAFVRWLVVTGKLSD